MNYFRIYDDNEELNFFKTSLDNKTIEQFLKEFETERKKFCNPDFVEFLKKKDVEAEIISIHNLSY